MRLQQPSAGARLCRPDADVWLLWGDGSAAYSLAEFDTYARHGIPVVAVVGNDAGWTQIAREQVEILKDDVGVVLARTDYHKVAEGYGGVGLLLVSGVQVARSRATVQAAVWAVLVYFLPAVLIGLALQLPSWAAPLSSAMRKERE